jgi:hypothetical protein
MGHLRQPDLLAVFKDMGETLTGEQLDAIFAEFDTDGSADSWSLKGVLGPVLVAFPLRRLCGYESIIK